MRDIELSSMGQGYPSLLTTRRPLTKAVESPLPGQKLVSLDVKRGRDGHY